MADLLATYQTNPVFPIDPQMVVPLPLHIMLGLVKDYSDMFRKNVSFCLRSLIFFLFLIL